MYKEQIESYWNDDAHRRELIDAIGRLVAVKSVRGERAPNAPYGPGPAAALDEALKLCTELGFKTRDYDRQVGLCDLPGSGDIRLHILGHLDVVGEGKDWDTDPYVMAQRDGMLYGRGVSDDKGPLCCALYAMKAVRDLGVPLTGGVRLLMGTDEESGSGDVAYYYAREPYAPYAFTPDADFPVINIEKGHYHPDFGRTWPQSTALPRVSALTGGFRTNVVPPEARATVLGLTKAEVESACAAAHAPGASFTVTENAGAVTVLASGRNAHAAWPDAGVNAITALLALLAALPLADCDSTKAVGAMHALFPFGDHRGKALGIAQEDAESGPLTLNLALITLTETGFTAKFDVRFPICATEENCKKACEASFAKHGITVTADGDMTTIHHVSADSPLVKTLLNCYSAYTGVENPQPIAIGGGTYVHDIPGGVAFGCDFPGFDPKMHAANEQASVENLILSCKIFTQAIIDLCQ